MKQTERHIPSGRIRKVEFIYDGTEESFTRFLTGIAMEYIRKEESKQTAVSCVHSTEFSAKT